MANKELSDRMLCALSRLQMISQRHHAELVSHRLTELRSKLEDNRFQLAVVGQFKRGKTSVLNALLGSEVLPVGAVPFTSIVTIVKYGDPQDALVVFRTGEQLSIPFSQLPDYVSEAGNPGNLKSVDHVEVSHPSTYLKDGVALVNSPGFGSPYDQTTRLANDFLPDIDAAIFVTSPDPPLTSAEITFLKNLAANVSRIFVVMNKADVGDSRSLRAVLEFTNQAVATAVGYRAPIYVVSAKQALRCLPRQGAAEFTGAGFRQLEQDLRHFLETDRCRVLFASILANILSAVGDLRLHLQLSMETAKASARDFQSKLLEFEATLDAALQEQQTNESFLMERISQICTLVDSETARFGESKSASVISAIKVFIAECREVNRARLASSMDRFICWQIQRTFDQWRPDFEGSVGRAARDALLRHLQATNNITVRVHRAIEAFRANSCQALETKVNIASIDERTSFTSSRYHTETKTKIHCGRLSVLLPDSLFVRRLLQKAIQVASLEVHRNAGEIAKDLRACLEHETIAFTRTIHQRLSEIIELARMAPSVSGRNGSAAACHQSITELAGDLNEVDHITNDLKTGLRVEYALEA